MHPCIAFLHTVVTRRRQREEHGNQQRVQPAKVTFCLLGKQSGSAAAESLHLFEVQPDCATYSSWQLLPTAQCRGITGEPGALQLQGVGSSFWKHCCSTAQWREQRPAPQHLHLAPFFPKLPNNLFQLGVGIGSGLAGKLLSCGYITFLRQQEREMPEIKSASYHA